MELLCNALSVLPGRLTMALRLKLESKNKKGIKKKYITLTKHVHWTLHIWVNRIFKNKQRIFNVGSENNLINNGEK